MSRTAAAVLVLGDIVVLLCRCVVLLNDLESCDFVVLDLLTVDAPSSSYTAFNYLSMNDAIKPSTKGGLARG